MNVNEYNNLLNKYIKLLFEKNKLIMRDAPYIESRYLFHFGDLMVEELKHNKYIKELRIKQNIYENYFGLKREKEIKNIQHEIKKQTGILSLYFSLRLSTSFDVSHFTSNSQICLDKIPVCFFISCCIFFISFSLFKPKYL